MLLERFKEGITVSHQEGESKERRNEKRHEALAEHFDTTFTLDKNTFLTFLERRGIQEESHSAIESLHVIDFTKANPRNQPFMNELAFAGQAVTEGFLECFAIEKKGALEAYTNQVQVIEKKEEGKDPQYYMGVFLQDKLMRVTPYEPDREHLDQLVQQRQDQQLLEQKEKTQKQSDQRSLTRRKEDFI